MKESKCVIHSELNLDSYYVRVFYPSVRDIELSTDLEGDVDFGYLMTRICIFNDFIPDADTIETMPDDDFRVIRSRLKTFWDGGYRAD
jgi:hypothetical protein